MHDPSSPDSSHVRRAADRAAAARGEDHRPDGRMRDQGNMAARPLRPDDALAGGRFRVVRMLGEGGCGRVYEALDQETRQRVALKIPSGTGERLAHEHAVLTGLTHPRVVRAHGLHGDPERPCALSLQLIDGVYFDEWVRPGDRAPSWEAGRLEGAALELLDALEAVHAAGLVHCDVKPGNVLVQPDGRLVLIDFDLTQPCGTRTPAGTEPDGLGSGTPAYMAPEQIVEQPVTPATDLYAFGAMLFEALTGRLPFSGHPHQVLFCKQWLNAPWPRELSDDVPHALDSLCGRLLSRDPRTRPALAEVRRVLQAACAGPERAPASASGG